MGTSVGSDVVGACVGESVQTFGAFVGESVKTIGAFVGALPHTCVLSVLVLNQ